MSDYYIYNGRIYSLRYLKHHGIAGQKWGKRNGPPYPLKESNKLLPEKKKESKNQLRITDNQKQYIVTGAAFISTALATINVIKSNAFNKLVATGKSLHNDNKKLSFSNIPLRRLPNPEKIEDSLRNANPLRGKAVGKNNCTNSAIAGYLRMNGFDARALPTGMNQQNLGGVIEDCFLDAKVKDGSAIKFGKSPKDAADMLVRKYGNNASGICSIQWKTGGGHAFNFVIKNGNVEFLDFKENRSHEEVIKYWRNINQYDALQICALDNTTINPKTITKYVTS